jgi:DNA recombination protein RmuC
VLEALIGVLIGLGIAAAAYAVLRRPGPVREAPSPYQPELFKAQMTEISQIALKDMGESFLRIAKRELEVERQRGAADLHSNRQAVEHTIRNLEDQLKEYRTLISQFEADRNTKYGRLESEIQQLTKNADQLQRTTASLTAVLGNSRVRGQWGQKMAEDILRLCGLQEGVQYRKELEIAAGRPDFTFHLPDGHALFMDVKFPLDHYLRFAEAQREDEQARCKDAFIKGVREHLRDMERRAYGATDQSVDYTILFIPNEQIYSAVNEWMPQLIDECLQKKLILCGPWTLYAIVRIIHQAWQNYQFSSAVRDIVRTINAFIQDYGKFKERFGELGSLLDKLDAKYREISVTSAQRLEGKIRRIEEYRKGQNIPEGLADADQLTLEQFTGSSSQ